MAGMDVLFRAGRADDLGRMDDAGGELVTTPLAVTIPTLQIPTLRTHELRELRDKLRRVMEEGRVCQDRLWELHEKVALLRERIARLEVS